MRMFLVGMCDIFLILYLTTLSQVNPFHNSYLTVDDYDKLKEAKIQAEHDSETSKAQILELKDRTSTLDREKERALQLVNIEKQKAAQAEIELSKTINEKEEFNRLLRKSQKEAEHALKIAKETQAEFEKARKKEERALQMVKEVQREVEKSRQNELNAIQIVKEVQVKAEKAKEDEQNALKTAEELRLKVEEAKKNEEESRRIAKDAQLKAEDALRKEEIARRIAGEERLKAEKARENETIALELAENAENLKKIALKNEEMARKAEANALELASVAKSETVKVQTKIKSITQTTDKAYRENILGKLTQFTVTIDYKDSLKRIGTKVITMQALPVKMGEVSVVFVPLDHIELGSSLTPDHYISYNISTNGKPVTKLYIKPGEAEIAALVINTQVKHCLPVDKTNDFSSFMPVLFAIRGQKLLGVMDRIRGVSSDFFVFKRDRLMMITRDEFYFDSEGFRGTVDYAEYIVKGDQIVDLDGNFIGFAYKKNKVLRIDNLNEWHEFSI